MSCKEHMVFVDRLEVKRGFQVMLNNVHTVWVKSYECVRVGCDRNCCMNMNKNVN